MKRFPWLIVAGALAIIALLVPAALRSARAQTTETQRAFVYGINAAIPDNFVGTFAPPSATGASCNSRCEMTRPRLRIRKAPPCSTGSLTGR